MVEIVRYEMGVSGIEQSKKFNRLKKMHCKKCLYGGVEYESLSKLASKLGVHKCRLSGAVKKGEYRGVKLTMLNNSKS